MAAQKPVPKKKYFTLAQANAMLPLVRRIIDDITVLAHQLRERQGQIARLRQRSEQGLHEEKLFQAEDEFERGRAQITEFVDELRKLGVELKDFFIGLVDFPCWMDGREVCLCWRQGEPEVAFWHEVDAGYAGRQKLLAVSQPQ